MPDAASFSQMWAALEPIGRSAKTGGYRRFAWTDVDRVLREWFAGEAERRGLDLTTDRAGNQWAWWGDPDAAGIRAADTHTGMADARTASAGTNPGAGQTVTAETDAVGPEPGRRDT